MSGLVRVFGSGAALAAAAAAEIAPALQAAADARGQAVIALAGGETPRRTYEQLGEAAIPWDRVQVCWGDERWAAPGGPARNSRMAHEALLSRVPIPRENVHPMPAGAGEPDDAAARYEETLRRVFRGAWPRFDVMVLGIGPDGHTASLFPGSPALDEMRRWVVATAAPDGRPRLTLTLPVLNRARATFVLAAGRGKAAAVRRALAGDATIPAGRLDPVDGRLVWFLDREASGERGA